LKSTGIAPDCHKAKAKDDFVMEHTNATDSKLDTELRDANKELHIRLDRSSTTSSTLSSKLWKKNAELQVSNSENAKLQENNSKLQSENAELKKNIETLEQEFKSEKDILRKGQIWTALRELMRPRLLRWCREHFPSERFEESYCENHFPALIRKAASARHHSNEWQASMGMTEAALHLYVKALKYFNTVVRGKVVCCASTSFKWRSMVVAAIVHAVINDHIIFA
jgi:hypothetical protein